MTDFNLSATVSCPHCRSALTSLDADHECVSGKTEHVFKQIGGETTRLVEAVTEDGAWRQLATETDPLPWAYYGPVRLNNIRPQSTLSSYYQRHSTDLHADYE